MFTGHYILVDKVPVEVTDLMEWIKQFKDSSRAVQQDVIGEIFVSTVFLGLDHSFGGGPPLLFETMIFGGEHDEYQKRYATWDEAIEGHKKALKLVTDGKPREHNETPD